MVMGYSCVFGMRFCWGGIKINVFSGKQLAGLEGDEIFIQFKTDLIVL